MTDDERLLRCLKVLCTKDYTTDAIAVMYRRIKTEYRMAVTVGGKKYEVKFTTSPYNRFYITRFSKYAFLGFHVEIFRSSENRVDWDEDCLYWEDCYDEVEERCRENWKTLKRNHLSEKIEDIFRKSPHFKKLVKEFDECEKRAMRYA